MKKIFVLLAFVLLAGAAFAQFKKDKASAYNYWMKEDLLKAKEFIDKAVTYPEASTDATVWYYKGGIYLNIQISPQKAKIAPSALNIAYEAYLKADEIDVKGKYTDEIKQRISAIGGEFFNEGVSFFEKEDYDRAIPLMEKAIKIAEGLGVTDTLAHYGVALCYKEKSLTDKLFIEKTITKYQYLVDIRMMEPDVYITLASLYLENNEMDKAKLILDLGKKTFPDNSSFK